MTPYYQDDWVTLYHGDALDYWFPLEIDVLVTDPPYGVGLGIDKDTRTWEHRAGLSKKRYASSEDTYDDFLRVVPPTIELSLHVAERGAAFTGPHMWDLPRPTAIGGVYCPSGSGCHPWGFKTFLPVLFYGSSPTVGVGNGAHGATTIQSTLSAEKNGHPCPKPLPWMRWLVGLASFPGETVFDPFAGSGTTLRAAKDLGRKSIGIEIEERYCEIAARVCAQEVMEISA